MLGREVRRMPRISTTYDRNSDYFTTYSGGDDITYNRLDGNTQHHTIDL